MDINNAIHEVGVNSSKKIHNFGFRSGYFVKKNTGA